MPEFLVRLTHHKSPLHGALEATVAEGGRCLADDSSELLGPNAV